MNALTTLRDTLGVLSAALLKVLQWAGALVAGGLAVAEQAEDFAVEFDEKFVDHFVGWVGLLLIRGKSIAVYC